MDFAGEITFKELCKKVKRALAQTRERERDEVNRKVTRLHKKVSLNEKKRAFDVYLFEEVQFSRSWRKAED